MAMFTSLRLAWSNEPGHEQGHESGSGTVSGQVTITRNLAAQRMRFRLYPSYKPIAPPPADAVRSDEYQNVVIYLQPVSFDLSPISPGTGFEIRQLGETFIPHVLPVTVGSTVSFPNLDPIFHNVFSLSRPKSFDLGRYPQNETRTVTFNEPGVVPLFCHLHSDMSAVVVVLDTPWYTIPEVDGQYRIADLPAGNYRVTAWHERSSSVESEITITAGQVVSLDLSIPIPDENENGAP
jgi:hypothetical protein